MSDLENIPTPSPLPSPSNTPYSLSERINIATRPVHSQLNRLIIARLPLALPPYTNNPSTYISGLLHIAPIYINFESLWYSILHAPPLPTSLSKVLDACDPASRIIDFKNVPVISGEELPKLRHTPKVCSRTNELLSHPRLPGLLRSGRLRADIRVLTGTPEHQIDAQLEAVSKNGKLSEFIAHTTKSVEANPHVLLAYAWVLYMALFSGGRYLRASLKEAGGSTEFWARSPSPVRPYSITRAQVSSERRNSQSETMGPSTERLSRRRHRSEDHTSKINPGLQFFNFIGDEDGEDIKLEFKKRITEAEILLTDGEKEDIILEAQNIFIFMVEMVSELDTVMGTNEDDIEAARLLQSSKFMKSRDSVLVTKERLLKTQTLSEDILRKPSHLEVFLSQPIAKVVHFNDGFQDVFMKPLARTLSGKLGRKVSLDGGNPKLGNNLLRVIVTISPVLALLLGFVTWYFVV